MNYFSFKKKIAERREKKKQHNLINY